MLAFAALFIFKSNAIVEKICKPADFEENATLFAERNVVYEIALTLMGLLMIMWSIPEFILNFKYFSQMTEFRMAQDRSLTTPLIIGGLKIAVGFIAIFYARSISLFFAKPSSAEKS
ncbi:hypothetical protein [Pedobacter sp. NJ-S-72]